ncbi:aminoglycoside phosphotransferase family protein [Sulfurivermis fontis]|uniref:aminoglycoside phosphotransferase family protein n=1 Tax=Sulfurivermis fontis TaxID=1972068 RepID=UPI000FDC854D|nr:phosphotransferase [Sulfurivermis fontis]
MAHFSRESATVPQRLEQLNHWLSRGLGLPAYDIAPASSDASFRRYFRIRFDGESRIVMDAPPDKEDSRPFVRIARALHAIGLHVPEILAEDLAQGFLLLSDLGSEQYLSSLNEASVGRLYGDAMGALLTLQACGPQQEDLPPYDEALLLREMELFREWYLGRHLGLALSAAEQRLLDDTFRRLAQSALEQPKVAVHRDYHSRNLMVAPHNPGILDFQDAVHGPVTYDLVSLLRDCYIAWPRAQVEAWALGYQELAIDSGILRGRDEERFLRWFDWMGVQRHLKATGIFARLNHRDGKPGYLKDIPRTLGYVREVAGRYSELAPLRTLLDERVPAAG